MGNFVLFFRCFWPCLVACGILVPRPGIEPGPSAVKALSPNHRTTREFHLLLQMDSLHQPVGWVFFLPATSFSCRPVTGCPEILRQKVLSPDYNTFPFPSLSFPLLQVLFLTQGPYLFLSFFPCFLFRGKTTF